MRVLGLAGFAALSVACAIPAQALTIFNVDPGPHTITVTAGGEDKKLTIEPSKEVEAPCAEGCKVRLKNGEIYEMKGGETLAIQDGVIFVDHSSEADANLENLPDMDPDADIEEGDGGVGIPEAE